MTDRREPIRHTCPDIDNCIKWLKTATSYINDAMDNINAISNQLDGETLHLDSYVSSAISDLKEAISIIDFSGTLEELRSANSILREWGIGLAEDLEKEILELEHQS